MRGLFEKDLVVRRCPSSFNFRSMSYMEAFLHESEVVNHNR